MNNNRSNQYFLRQVFIIFFITTTAFAIELITPIPLTIDYHKEKADLGKKLFFDPLLSKDGTISCASCHILDEGGDDNRAFSIGIGGREGSINAPTVLNAQFNFRQFWDGRAKDLHTQVLEPIENPLEMANKRKVLIQTIDQHKGYSRAFNNLYDQGVTLDNIIDAIVEFEKALFTPNAPFDDYLRGRQDAISKEAEEGYMLFKSKGCIACHNGMNIGGNLFTKFGVMTQLELQNLGRFNITKAPEDKFLFKVPSLRNIAKTAPYFHMGSIDTLEGAVRLMAKYQLGIVLEEEEVAKIVAFLETLSGETPYILRRSYDR
ncbi:MAG: cytochrome-c peroxidase [Epsilonproteobacteria bacterium]|nr:cytochrome-c peroxidase [Campylobacterota bacterium]